MRSFGGASFALSRCGLLIAVLLVGSASVGAAPAFGVKIAAWQMNEPAGATTMHDGSGSNLSGTIGSAVITGVVTDGATGYRWPSENRSGVHPERLVTVDSSRLNPGTNDFAVIVRFYTASFGDQNIVQKGQARTRGGMWKIVLFRGKVRCNFKGSVHRSAIESREIVADKAWHRVRCERRSTGVTLILDGGPPRTNPRWTGDIANTWPLSIGGKPKCNPPDVGCDYFVGRLDRVVVKRLR
jgi:hypothetical protein